MKIKLVDGTIHVVNRAEITNGRLEIDFRTQTAETLQEIFTESANLDKIELLTDDSEKFGELPGWTVFGGVMLVGKTKTVILTKETDTTQERLVRIESNALAAKSLLEDAANQITDLQMALTEIYEGLEVQQSPDPEETPVD